MIPFERAAIIDKIYRVRVMREYFDAPVYYLVIADSEEEAITRIRNNRAQSDEETELTARLVFSHPTEGIVLDIGN